MKNRFLFFLCFVIRCLNLSAKDITLTSPNGKLVATIGLDGTLTYAVTYHGVQAISPSALTLTLENGTILGQNPKVTKQVSKTIQETLTPVAYRKNQVVNHCNQLTLTLKGGFSVDFRAYDNGFAYRFNLAQGKGEVIIKNEQAEFNFAEDYPAYYAYSNSPGTVEQQFSCSFENLYNHTPLSQMGKDKIAFLPALVELPQNVKAVVTEVNQFSYPGMFLQNFQAEKGMKGIFAPLPKTMEQGGHNMLQMLVKERYDYLAKVQATRSLPWRAIAFSQEDKDMTDNDLVYCLADNTKLTDTSWIKPGKVAWDWWNDWNIQNVDFRAGINTETYEYYIDFASRYGIEYVILDEGWAVNLQADMMQVVPEIDLKRIIEHGKKKNVGIILWGGYKAMDKDMENLCKHYSEMGVKGFKIDFMDRDDQLIVDFYNRLAETAAKYHLMIDFHGAFKPSGMNRTWPNVINYEGVSGLENMKWSTQDQVTYDVTLPFIRLVAGPMDYTQGAMINANKANFRAINSEPMSQGTRCRQLAEYIIFESPLNMLCDSPTNYMKEPDYTKFLAQIPTTWDETRTLDGKIAEYIVTARRKGNDWYIAGLTNWDKRTLKVDLSFLGDLSQYDFECYTDGINADRRGTDYKRTFSKPASEILMQPGGGFLIKATKK
ncbi:MAG: glycoside hydrolase family 97 protein [Bacteroidales bacterium]|nr:glycoside hydrolase family 97 protein [Bacteroidales bacterium]